MASAEIITPCPTICDDDCELGTAGCHERHLAFRQRDHDPEACERQRAALDELSRLGEEIGDLPAACMMHWKAVPCRRDGCGPAQWSSDPEDLLRVIQYQRERS